LFGHACWWPPMARASLVVDEEIKEALAATPHVRGLKLAKDPKRPRWIAMDSIAMSDSLEDDFEKIAPLLKDHEACAVLVRLKDADGTLTAGDIDWVLITWSPENLPAAALQKHNASTASLQEKFSSLKLAEMKVSNLWQFSWEAFVSTAEEIGSGENISPERRKSRVMNGGLTPKSAATLGQPGFGFQANMWATSERPSVFAPAARPSRVIAEEAKSATSALQQYSGSTLDMFQQWVIITSYQGFIDAFSSKFDAPITMGSAWQCAHAEGEDVSLIHHTGGPSSAALIIDVLGRIDKFELVLFAGLVGPSPAGVDLYGTFLKTGEIFVPIGAVRGEGVSDSYLPAGVPAAPDTQLLCHVLGEAGDTAHKGILYSMSLRFYEYDEALKERINESTADALDAETATVFAAARKVGIKAAAMHLVSDSPFAPPKDPVLTQRMTQTLAPAHVERAVRVLASAGEILHTSDKQEVKRYMRARVAKAGGS